MAAFHPSELDDGKYNNMYSNVPDTGGDDEKKMSGDTNLGFNEMEAIRDEIKKKQPLVSEIRPLSTLLDEFKEQPNFRRQVASILDSKTHNEYRPMRQDGNCFYRAFLLALFEYIEKSGDSTLLAQISENAMSSLFRLEKLQYESFTIEDFYDTFMDELRWLQSLLTTGSGDGGGPYSPGTTTEMRLSNEFHSQSLIFWARMLASLHIQENKDDFVGFIQGKSLHEFIKADVEALHAEADHPQFSALASALNVPFRVYTIENIDKGGPNIVHSLGEHRKPIFDLLFRPGHYDIIYRSKSYDDIIDQQRQQTMAAADSNDTNTNTNNNNDNSNNNASNSTNDNKTNSNTNANNNADSSTPATNTNTADTEMKTADKTK